MKIGRNDLCHCGSGKKYKKCCMEREQNLSQELHWQRVHNASNALIKKLFNFAIDTYGEYVISEAWADFQNTEEHYKEFEFNSPFSQLFFPWFYYHWLPSESECDFADSEFPFDLTPAEYFLEKNGRKIGDIEKQYLEECCEIGFSFYEVTDVIAGKEISVLDIFTGDQFTVIEKKGSQGIGKHEVFFGKVINVNGICIFDALSPYKFPAISKTSLIELREEIERKCEMKFQRDDLFEFEEILREEFWCLYHEVYEQEKIFTNTSGDLFIPHKMTYEIDSLDKTFDCLHKLCLMESKEQILKSAKRDKSGNIVEIDFPWLKKGNKTHKSWENTIFGHITLEKNKMIVEVNSKERSEEFIDILKKKMPQGSYRLISNVVESIESKLKEMDMNPQNYERDQEQDELMKRPEVIQHLEKTVKLHWENWLSQPLPVLKGLTPQEASKTKAGREKLYALLNHFEQMAIERPHPGQTVETFKNIRNQLGL